MKQIFLKSKDDLEKWPVVLPLPEIFQWMLVGDQVVVFIPPITLERFIPGYAIIIEQGQSNNKIDYEKKDNDQELSFFDFLHE
jgi:hypothetical protein